MALQIGTVDGLINIGPKITDVFVKAIDAFSKQGVEYAKSKGIALGAAFQRFTYPVYSGAASTFEVANIDTPVYTKSGKEQSPAFITYCRKMGLLIIDESKSQFGLTTIGEALLDERISLQDYALIILSKQGVFQNGIYKAPLFTHVVEMLNNYPSITVEMFQQHLTTLYNDSDIEKTRLDILLGAFAISGLLVKDDNAYYIGGMKQAKVLEDIEKNCNRLSPALLDDDDDYTLYIGEAMWGIFDILRPSNIDQYHELFPKLTEFAKLCGSYLEHRDSGLNDSLQKIFYGAPGTGKSHTIKETTKLQPTENVFRTTFHPDSDYATFVGCYKPTKVRKPVRDMAGNIALDKNKNEIFEESITYEFVPQAFTKAYIRAWQTENPVFLVIEEINRGNCAQIFGDLFQLLDREDGASKYPIKPDSDLGSFIHTSFKKDGCKVGEKTAVYKGEELILPSNLYIWASMNTSDQSLFPIDSAFKRRWDWEYMPIENHPSEDYKIKVNGTTYDWWEFVKAINKEVFELTHSEDKQLGYFFVRPQNRIVDANMLVNKVYFYLWNDVFKDYDIESQKAFRKSDSNEAIAFKDFFDGGLNEELAEQILINLEVEEKY